LVGAALIASLLLVSGLAAVAEPKAEQCVRVSLRSDLLTMNPFMQSLIDESSVMELVYDTLYRQAPNGSFIPWLAEKVEVKENGTLWIFHLRRGVKWHDGTELTAEDVAFTLNLTVKYKFPTRSNVWEPIEKVWVVDGYTVAVKLKYPYAAFEPALAFLYIVKKDKWEKVEDPMTFSNFENPIGTGPFKWKERKAGDYIVLERNPDYWAGAPKVDCVIFKIYKSSDAAYIATLKGEIDAMNNLFIPPHLVPEALKKAEEDPALEIHFRKPIYFQYITVKLTKYPFNIKEFREAMLYAIDVNKIVQVVYGGRADPGSLGTMPPVFGEMPQKWYRPGLEKEKLYPFNPEKAREILDKLGFVDRDGDGVRETPNGTKLEFELLASTIYPDRIRIAEMVKDWFSQIGIKVNVKALDHRTVVSKLLDHDFDMVVIGIWLTDPDDWYLILHSSGAKKGGFNTAEYKNPEVDKLLEMQRMTVDVEKRRELLWKIQETVAHDIPYIPLVHIQEAYLYRVDRFKGWVLSPIMMPAQFWSFMSLEPVTAKPAETSPTATAPATSPATSPATTKTTTESPSPTTTSPPATSPTTTAAPGPGTATVSLTILVVVLIVAVVAYLLRRR
jgi:peptide/nickel transport system substrate-binding protein